MDEAPKPAYLTWTNIGIGLLFLLLDALLSVTLQLGLSTSLLTAAARCVVQLTVMVRLQRRFNVPCGVDASAALRGWFSKRCSRQTIHGLSRELLVRNLHF